MPENEAISRKSYKINIIFYEQILSSLQERYLYKYSILILMSY